MKIVWAFAENTILPPTVDIRALKNIAPIWGSWRTLRSYQTDNAICWDSEQAAKLINTGYSKLCNLYISQKTYNSLRNPENINYFGGDIDISVDSIDDIITLHLAAQVADVILLVGFDLETRKTATQSRTNYIGLTAQTFRSNSKQWVLVDHYTDLASEFQNITNLTRDNLSNVLKLLTPTNINGE